VNYIWNKGKLTSHGLASLLVGLVERGDASLSGDSGQGFSFKMLRECSSPHPEERAAAHYLAHLELTRANSRQLVYAQQACGRVLQQNYRGQWKSNFLLCWLNFIPALLGLAFLLRCSLGPLEMWPYEVYELAFLVSPCLMMCVFGIVVIRRIKKISNFFQTLVQTAIYLLALSVTGIFLYEFFMEYSYLWLFSPIQFTLIFLILLTPLVFCYIMPIQSKEIMQLRQEISGLALYIHSAEARRMDIALSEGKSLEVYHRLLPYAIALQLENAWGRCFADELRTLTQGEKQITKDITALSAMVCATDHCCRAYKHPSAGRASPRVSGSSFSGFGGSAGSGGGGGGGGVC